MTKNLSSDNSNRLDKQRGVTLLMGCQWIYRQTRTHYPYMSLKRLSELIVGRVVRGRMADVN